MMGAGVLLLYRWYMASYIIIRAFSIPEIH